MTAHFGTIYLSFGSLSTATMYNYVAGLSVKHCGASGFGLLGEVVVPAEAFLAECRFLLDASFLSFHFVQIAAFQKRGAPGKSDRLSRGGRDELCHLSVGLDLASSYLSRSYGSHLSIQESVFTTSCCRLCQYVSNVNVATLTVDQVMTIQHLPP